MKKVYYTYFSLLILFLTILLFVFAPKFLLYFHLILIIPLLLALIGLTSALFGSKGEIRMVLVVLHLFILIVFASVYLLGMYGFKEP